MHSQSLVPSRSTAASGGVHFMDIPNDVLRLIVTHWLEDETLGANEFFVCKTLHGMINEVLESNYAKEAREYLHCIRVTEPNPRLLRRVCLRNMMTAPFRPRPFETVRCGATTRNGGACKRKAHRGSRLCRCAQHDLIEQRRYEKFVRT